MDTFRFNKDKVHSARLKDEDAGGYGYLSKVAYKLMKDSEEKHDSAKKLVETNNSSIEKGRAENIDKDLFKGGIFVEYKGA